VRVPIADVEAFTPLGQGHGDGPGTHGYFTYDGLLGGIDDGHAAGAALGDVERLAVGRQRQPPGSV